MFDLFHQPADVQPAKAPRHALAGRGIPLRWCQREDADALMHAIATGHKRPCCVGATGIGKGAIIAEVVGRLLPNGKVLCLVDRAFLVHQLANEIERHLGIRCGRIADGEMQEVSRQVVVSTVQAMYTPDQSGVPLYEYAQFKGVKSVVCDEAHKFFADCFRAVPSHFAANQDAIIVLFTATPVASNGSRWESFVDWTPGTEGPCMRTVGWCIRNGLLVPPRQAFVDVRLDLSQVRERLSEMCDDDESEDTGDELADLLLGLLSDKGERAGATFAAGIADVIGERQAIIFSPPKIQAAKVLSTWLNATRRLTAEPVWGNRPDKTEVLARFNRGDWQILTNVNLLCEGFNSPAVSAVFICRLLKQWRLAQQMVGRALRPHHSIMNDLSQLDGPDNALERRALIASSVKPDAIIADLIGSDGKVLQASAVDVLYAEEPDDVRMEVADILRQRPLPTPREQTERPDDSVLEEARSKLLEKQHEQLAEMTRRRAMAGNLPVSVSVTFDRHAAPVIEVPTSIAYATVGEKARFVAMATQYDAERAKAIADKTPRHQLRGMCASLQKQLSKQQAKPDWRRARQAYPEWAAAKDGAQ